MKHYLILFIFCSSFVGLAQYQVTIEAFILDYATKKPVPYVNIGFVEKSIGTVTDENGAFKLIYDEDEISLKDVLQISALGYETTKVSPRQLVRLLTNTDKIYLNPKPEILEEVVITNENRKKVSLGDMDPDYSAIGYWKDRNALGGEIATILDIKKKNTRLKNIKFSVLENQSDSLKVRVNVYEYKRGFPTEKIITDNIFHTISQKEGDVNIDLEPYNIKVDKDCVIGIELVKVYGETIEFAISGKLRKGTSYKRYVSQDKWSRNSNIGMSFGVQATIPVKEGEKGIAERKKPEKITIYWDVSSTSVHRNIEQELKFLKSYLKTLKHLEIEVIKFNNAIQSRKQFTLANGDSNILLDYLRVSYYNGAVNYAEILKDNDFDADTILLFTTGNTLFKALETEVYIPTFTINSSPDANHLHLQRTAYYADGHYIDLTRASAKEAMDYMINEVADTIDYTRIDDKGSQINGKVFTVSGPVQGASIRVKNTFIEVQSDVEGFFEIRAEVGDVLIASYLGMKDTELTVIDPQNTAILLKPDGQLLDEVFLTGKGKDGEEVETSYGKKEKDALGFSVETITEEDIGPQYNTLADVIVGKFAGVQVVGLNVGYQTPLFIIRGGGGSLNPTYAMFDVDGNIYGPGQDLPIVNVQNIATISILKSLIATNRYGQTGRGGAIVIKTKSLLGTDGNLFESALVTGNDYNEQGVIFLQSKEYEHPAYITKLKASISFEGAKRIYDELRKDVQNRTIPFYFDVSDYFMQWDKKFAYSILTNIAAIANENPKALNSLAYKMEELGHPMDAQLIYERLAELRPEHEQPFRDLARIYVINKEYQKAMDLYKRMLAGVVNNVEFVGLQRTIENELMHLLSFHRSQVDYSALPNDLRTAKFKYDLRIVFDWNDPSAEFEIQFVNPNKKYFTWSHTRTASKDRLLDEIKYGYNTEEFIIDDADSGEWIINIESLNNEPLVNPTYLKYTVFKNYGLAEETKEVKVIKLYQQRTKVTLDKFHYQ